MANSDYISREAVKEIIAAQCGECADACLEFDGIQPDCNQCLLYGAKKAIESIPAADVRPVVRCRDCMYAPSGTDDGEDQGFALEWPYDEWPEDNPCPCKCEDGWYSHKPKPDFFCANGKRKES